MLAMAHLHKSKSENVHAGTRWRSQYHYMHQQGLGKPCPSGYRSSWPSRITALAQQYHILVQLPQWHILAHAAVAAVTVLLDMATLHMLLSLNPMLGLINDFRAHRWQFCQLLPCFTWALPSICLYIDSLHNTSNHAVLVVWRLFTRGKQGSWPGKEVIKSR